VDVKDPNAMARRVKNWPEFKTEVVEWYSKRNMNSMNVNGMKPKLAVKLKLVLN
jgi:hypothetical protein